MISIMVICMNCCREERFLNQARAGLWPACAWFLKIYLVQIVGIRACVCVSAPELSITSGVMWRYIDLI